MSDLTSRQIEGIRGGVPLEVAEFVLETLESGLAVQVRRDAGLTQKQVGDRAGVSAQTISNWEHQRSTPVSVVGGRWVHGGKPGCRYCDLVYSLANNERTILT